MVCWNPDCRCLLLPKSRRLPFSGFLPLDVSSPTMGDILRSGRCRCIRCRGSQRKVLYELLQRTLLHRPFLRMSPTAMDETSRPGEGILRMEGAGTSEEEDTDSQDSNIPTDHGHLAQNCSIKIIEQKLFTRDLSTFILFLVSRAYI